MAAAMEVETTLPEPVPITGPPWDPRILIDRAAARYIPINESYPGLTKVGQGPSADVKGDRHDGSVHMTGHAQVNVDPPIFTVRGFLSPAECKRLQDQGAPGLVRSVVVDAVGGISPSSTRTSSSCFLLKSETVWLAERIAALTGRPPETHEPPQVARYNAGEFYKAHFDAFDLASESGRGCYLTGGQACVWGRGRGRDGQPRPAITPVPRQQAASAWARC